MVRTKAVQVQDYDPLSENGLIVKIVNILLLSDKPVDYIKERFPEYFSTHIEHISLYRNQPLQSEENIRREIQNSYELLQLHRLLHTF
jgi:hypothetical protein